MSKNRVWKFGDNIDTDLIIAARYLNTSDPKELAKYVMEDADPSFKDEVRAGDIVVAGENFGCGSSNDIDTSDSLEILPKDGIIKNITKNRLYHFKPIPPFMLELLESGGLMEYAKKEILSAQEGNK